MAVMEVNHQTLRNMAQSIDDYCETQKREMSRADTAVKEVLGTGWVGADAAEFGKQWEGVDAPDSTSGKLRASLEQYGEALRACANAYQTAQEDVYNRAYLLPRY